MHTDSIEIEQKYRIATVDAFHSKLAALNAKPVGVEHQVDIYYNVPGRDSYSTKECLRIRTKNGASEITYKAPTKEGDTNVFYAKREIDVDVHNPDAARDLLDAIGCTILAVVDKSRTSYELDNLTVAIDTIARLGSFVEIEALVSAEKQEDAVSRINVLARKLDLSDSDLVTRPYRDLVMEVVPKA